MHKLVLRERALKREYKKYYQLAIKIINANILKFPHIDNIIKRESHKMAPTL